MSFASVYPHYLTKAEKKGRNKSEVDECIALADGLHARGFGEADDDKTSFRDMFENAPKINANA